VQTEEITKNLGKPSQQKQWRHYDSEQELMGNPRAKDFGADKIMSEGAFQFVYRRESCRNMGNKTDN